MLLPEMRMVAPLPAACSAVPLFAIVERSILAVEFVKTKTASPPLPEMIDLVTLTNTLELKRTRPLSDELAIDLVMLTGPKPPGSRQLISPPGAVFPRAPWKVWHGAVRLQGLASSPVPDTQVRASSACAGAAAKNGNASPMTARESAAA